MLGKKIFENFPLLFQSAKININYGSLSTFKCLIKSPIIDHNRLYLKQKYHFAAVSIKDMKVTYDPSKKTEIISLNQ